MSVLCEVLCLDCRDAAPPVGDGGFVGGPSLEIEERQYFPGWNRMPSFESLYEALAAVQIIPYELSRYRDWLVQHRGHRLTMYATGEDLTPELEAIMDEWDKRPKRELVERDRQREAQATQAQAEGRFVNALYHVSCEACGEELSSPEPAPLRAFEPAALTVEAIDLYLERWGPANDDRSATYHLMNPIVDCDEPFVPELCEFFRRHRDHGVSITLTPDV